MGSNGYEGFQNERLSGRIEAGMSDNELKLLKAPIIEAVLDIDCDMPPGREIASLEKPALECLRGQYPEVRPVLVQMHHIEKADDQTPKVSMRNAMHGLQFLHQDQKQVVQFRTQGFSFNRLAPYSSLDDYLPEIERTWKLFVSLASPVQIRAVRLRYINRIMLPMPEPVLNLDDYLKVAPHLPDQQRLTFTGFLNQHTAVETGTGNLVTIVLSPLPAEDQLLPLILDITAESHQTRVVEDWAWLLSQIQALRDLKNRVFRNTLTEKCLNLFRQP